MVSDEETNFPKGSFIRYLNDFIEVQVNTKPFENKRKNNNGDAPVRNKLVKCMNAFYS